MAVVMRRVLARTHRLTHRPCTPLPQTRFIASGPLSLPRDSAYPFRPAIALDSTVFSNILSSLECASIWSDTTRTSYYLQFESALATVQARLGIIPQKAADEIVKHCDIERIDWPELKQQTELIGYPVLPVVKQVVRYVNGIEAGLGEWAHWGATTQVRTSIPMSVELRNSTNHLSRHF